MKKVVLSALIMLASSAAFADSSSGTVSALHVHEHFSMFDIKGETAQKIYNGLQTQEKEDGNAAGQKMGSLSKVSADGRMWCQKDQGIYKCQVTFDTTTGSINQTWLK
ncbi:MAG TPA: hypothetical protein VIG33_08855 [Pseudobdellovibrionaceae bacterium]|jgi:hypothetical protein